MAVTDVLLGAGAAVLGSAMTVAGQWLQGSRQRRHDVTSGLRQARSEAHRDLLREAQLAGHLLTRTAAGHPVPLADSEVPTRIDVEVMHRVYQVELVADVAAREAALELRRSLFDLRDVVRSATWHDDQYMPALHAYQAARAHYIETAREELLRDLA